MMKRMVKFFIHTGVISLVWLSCTNKRTPFFSSGKGSSSHDTLYLGCIIFRDEIKIPDVIDTLYYVEFKNKPVLKTIDSIIKNQKVFPGRKWLITGTEKYYKLIYSSESSLFADARWTGNHFYLPLNDVPVFFKVKTVPASQYTIDKKHFVFVRHPPDTLCDFLFFDHPLTYYIDQKGKILLIRFKEYFKNKKHRK